MNGEKEGASMELGHGIFDVKLHELKREYVRMQSRLRLFQGKDFGSSGRDRAEAVTLCAEVAMDFAPQTMRYAMITALNAMELQIQADKPRTEGEDANE